MDKENIENKIELNLPIATPEKKLDQVQEAVKEKSFEKIASGSETEKVKPVYEKIGAVTNPVVSDSQDDYHQRREKEIDNLLSEGLSETFLAMTPEKQKIFKEEGEKTTKKINILLDATKVNIGKIVNLIKHWLGLITGVNRFFLDQEAKIKADKIIKIKNKL